MIAHEIIHSCSNAHMARAALASIGGDFASHFADRASRLELSPGELAAHMVVQFSIKATDQEWVRFDRAARDVDQPILSGLTYILSQPISK